jgi:preprotein translocase subunit SecG
VFIPIWVIVVIVVLVLMHNHEMNSRIAYLRKVIDLMQEANANRSRDSHPNAGK